MINTIMSHGGIRQYLYSNEKLSGFPSNPSCVVYNDKLVVNLRVLDYLYPVHFDNLESSISHNFIGYVDSNGCIDGHMLRSNPGPFKYAGKYAGREDVRLVNWNEKLYGYCARPDMVENRVVIEVMDYDEYFRPRSLFMCGMRDVEKNWMAIEDTPFGFIYDNVDMTRLVINQDQTYQMYRGGVGVSASGGTCYINYHDGYLGIVHRHEPWPNYEHQFVYYDKNWKLTNYSRWFKFSKYPVEFAVGLCLYHNEVIITFSEYDMMPQLIKCPVDTMDWILGMMDEPPLWDRTPENQPQFLDDIYQDIPYQIYRGDRSRLIEDLESINIPEDELINKLNLYI